VHLSLTVVKNGTATIGKEKQYQVDKEYNGTGNVIYTLVGAPKFITINATTGLINIDASVDSDKGFYPITVKASDGKLMAKTSITIHVMEPIVLLIDPVPKQTITRDQTFQYQIKTKYNGTGTLKYSLISSPNFITINQQTGLISADTDNLVTSKDYVIKVAVTDGTINKSVLINLSVALSAELEKCLQGNITAVTSDQLYALSGSMFSDELYVQGDPNWKPKKIQFKIEDENKQPLKGCDIYVRPQQTSSSIYFPVNSISDKNGLVTGYWESKKGESSVLLASLLQDQSDKASINGVISQKPFKNTAPSPYLRFGSNYRWKEFNIDITVLAGSNPTFFQIANWFGGYIGLQEADWKEQRKLIFSVWKTKYGIPQLLTDSPYCVPMTDSEGTFEHCLMDYPWQYGKTYTFNITAEHNVDNAIDYTVKVQEKGSLEKVTVATIRQPQDNNYYPGTPSSFIEQWTKEQDSCLKIQPRTAVYSNISAIKPGESVPFNISNAQFSRPYIASYGGGSLCFNYAYGNTTSLPISKNIKNGFVASVGGDLVSYPSDGALKAASPDVNLHNKYYILSKLNDLKPINDQEYYLSQILFENKSVKLVINDDNYMSEINLPKDANYLNIINIDNESKQNILVNLNKDNSQTIPSNSQRIFIYNNGEWVPSKVE
ncbi:DUF3472 domain-containing protein, partial [Vibrio parahaemolyticus]|nr:DUF3472 domain-containing protein [Vibrio parahaemolyticus]